MSVRPVMGADDLRALGTPAALEVAKPQPFQVPPLPVGLQGIVDQLAERPPELVLCIGKDGVGKTTVAQAIAVGLTRAGKPVHLSTTDPAANLNVALEAEGMEVSAIDPEAAVDKYRAQVLATKDKTLDADGYAQLEEDLRSPCTEEVALFREFSSVVAEADEKWVVLDTAPTGHTLLLLDATGSYHRELQRQSGESVGASTLKPLQNAAVTFPIIVTLPETTPVFEAQTLVNDLKRAEITPWAWVINQSLPATSTSSPFLKAHCQSQAKSIKLACDGTQAQIVQLPYVLDGVGSVEGLTRFLGENHVLTCGHEHAGGVERQHRPFFFAVRPGVVGSWH